MVIRDIRNYETTFIIRPDRDATDFESVTSKFTNLIKDNGGEILSQEIWGMRRLAYTIEGHNTGYYVFTEFRAPGDIIRIMERDYEYDERVIRHLTVRLDKYAAEWNERRRSKLKNQAQQVQTT